MFFNLDENINNFLKIIVQCAKAQNINVYFVGGIVRDNILNKPLKDIDLIVEANALEFIKYLPSEIIIKSIHKDFYTVKVRYKNLEIDIASTREEIYPYSGCLPVIKQVGVSIEKDYIRRDFSINSLYALINCKNNNLNYELIDLSNGYDDIKNKTLRVLHDRSYIDDPTRILRGINFKYRLGFDFSSHDKLLIKEYFKNPDTEKASKDRILSVFELILSNEFADEIFKDIIKNGYYKLINNFIECDLNLIKETILKFNVKEKNEFYLKILLNECIENIKAENEISLKHVFSKLKNYELAYYYYRTKDDNALKYLEIKDIDININGDDLIKLGFIEGKNIGIILNNLLLQKIKNPKSLATKQDELNWIKKNYTIST